MTSNIPSELAGLIHNVKLNEMNWLNKYIRNSILAFFLEFQDKRANINEIRDYLHKKVNISDSIGYIIDEELHSLCKENILIELSENFFKIENNEEEKLRESIEKYKQMEESVVDIFTHVILPKHDTLKGLITWESFESDFLDALIMNEGAKVYEVFLGEKSDSIFVYDKYISSFPKEFQNDVRCVIIEFFNYKDNNIKNYICSKLTSYFCVRATGLKKEDLDRLLLIADSKTIELNYFLDTNMLFSIIGLHENPSNTSVLSLADIINKINRKNVRIKLYVLPQTLQEAKKVIDTTISSLENISLSPILAKSVTPFSVNGIIQKFLNDVANQKTKISAKEYFEPYSKNLLAIIRSKGVELYNDFEAQKYSLDSRLIEEINTYFERVEKKEKIYNELSYESAANKVKKFKRYEQLVHDYVLWFYVHDKRGKIIFNPLEAKYWVATLDYAFIRFDKEKSKGSKCIPICIHPNQLLQILQFWVPADELYESILVNCLKQPLYFYSYNTDFERVTISILRTLSRYENINDLPENVIASVFLNEALREKIHKASTEEEETDLINGALIAEYNKLTEIVSEKELANKELQMLLEKKSNITSELENEIRNLRQEIDTKSNDNLTLQNELINIRNDISSLKRIVELGQWEKKKDKFINDEWEKYSSSDKYTVILFFVIILFITVVQIFCQLFFNNYEVYVKYGIYINAAFVLVNILLNLIFYLCSVDKVKKSFNLLFRRKEANASVRD